MFIANINKQSGVTLIEVLISVLILSVGLLGLAAMQLHASRFNHSAYLRSQASFLAYDYYDRMRSNRAEAINETSYLLNLNTTPATPSNCSTSACNESEMAAFDKSQWKQAVTSLLPDSDAEVTTANLSLTGTKLLTITIFWQDSRQENAAKESFIFKAEL